MMTTRDLLENASLDALGLLDEADRDQFERAFRAASPEVQAMVRREQVRFSDVDAWLPKVEAPVGLKAKVLSAWRDAVAAVAEQSEPVATIGPGYEMLNHRRMATGPIWRAACIGFATATVVLGGFFYWVSQMNQQITTQMAINRSTGDVAALGPRVREILFSPNKKERRFAPAAADVGAKINATLLYDAEKRTAVLMCDRLPTATGKYTLVFQSTDGGTSKVKKSFEATGGFASIPVELQVDSSGEDPMKRLDNMAIMGPKTPGGPDEVILKIAGSA